MKIPSYGIMTEKGIFSMGQIESWFEENGRDFPWRGQRTPYRVWVSEVMLQQTRAAVVVPYFERWMERFPDVKALYMAPIEQVIKAWEGLGYYSRARNLHLAAQQIVELFGGKIPDSRTDLLSLRGFGPYTAAAVLSFGFQKRAVAVDGNVLRVLSRYFLIEENISKQRVRREIEERGESLLDPERPWVTAEGLIELGATVCLPKPRCDHCPLRGSCLAFQEGKSEGLPIKDETQSVTVLKRLVFVIEHEGFVLVKKGEKGKIMADLYEFPYLEKGEGSSAQALYGGSLKMVRPLREFSHAFTRYKAFLSPSVFRAVERRFVPGYEWISISSLRDFPFSSGHRKIAEEVAFLSSNMVSLSEQ